MSYKDMYAYLSKCKMNLIEFDPEEYAKFAIEAPILYRIADSGRMGLNTVNRAQSWTACNPRYFLDSNAPDHMLLENVLYPVWNQRLDEKGDFSIIEVEGLYAAPALYSDPDIVGTTTMWVPDEQEWIVPSGTVYTLEEVMLFHSDIAGRTIKWYKGTIS